MPAAGWLLGRVRGRGDHYLRARHVPRSTALRPQDLDPLRCLSLLCCIIRNLRAVTALYSLVATKSSSSSLSERRM